MEKLRALMADGAAWLAASTPREKRLLAMAARRQRALIVLIAYAQLLLRHPQGRKTSLEEKQLDFEKISRLAAGFGAQEQWSAAARGAPAAEPPG